jgi:hypothetical protein
LAAEAHRAEGQCLLQGQAPNNENTLRLLGGTRRLIIIIIIIIINIIIINDFFFNLPNPSSRNKSWVYSASNRNEYQKQKYNVSR